MAYTAKCNYCGATNASKFYTDAVAAIPHTTECPYPGGRIKLDMEVARH